MSHSLLTRLRSLVDIDVDLQELRSAGEVAVEGLTQATSEEPEITAYVRKLEQRYDAEDAPTGDIPMPEDMVQELERFLKGQGRPPDDGA